VNTVQRRIAIGLALVGSLAATGWVASQDEPATAKPRARAPETEQARPAAAAARSRTMAAPSASTPGLTLDKLNRAKAEASADDLFETHTWQPPPPLPPKPAPPPPPVPPALPFAYIGKMSEDGQTIVFLDAADRSYAARIGDVLNGRYKVDDIKGRTLVLTYLPLKQQQTLDIGD
jgi:hypothetical protein